MNINKFLHSPNVAGQSLVDRVTAAKHSLAGERLAKFVCKATTEEQIPPKKKHIDRLIRWSHDANISVPQMAGLLLERSQNDSWIVVFKALVSTHTLMNYGSERFIQFLASNNVAFTLDSFNDNTSSISYNMSPCIRRYAKYLNAKAFSYRQMAYDFCKIKKGKEDGVLRVMEVEFLLKALPVLQAQVDALLEFDVTKSDLTNSVINACFLMLFKDLIRLLACYNDAIINLLAKYFSMSRKQCKESLELYKKFVVRMELVAKFLAVAESVGIDKGDIPDLAKAPSSLLEALESHLKSLESGRKASRSGAASSEMAALAQSSIASLSNQNVFALDQFAALPPTNPFADLLESSTASATPSDDFADDLEQVVLSSASAANNPFLSSLSGGVNGAVAVDTNADPWSSQNTDAGTTQQVSGFATAEQFEAAFGEVLDFSGEPAVDGGETGLSHESEEVKSRQVEDSAADRNDGRETVEVETTSPEEQSAANGVQLDAVSQSPPATSAAETKADTPAADAAASEEPSQLPQPESEETAAENTGQEDEEEEGYLDLR